MALLSCADNQDGGGIHHDTLQNLAFAQLKVDEL